MKIKKNHLLIAVIIFSFAAAIDAADPTYVSESKNVDTEAVANLEANLEKETQQIRIGFAESALKNVKGGIQVIENMDIYSNDQLNTLISLTGEAAGAAMSCSQADLQDGIFVVTRDFLSSHPTLNKTKIGPVMRHIKAIAESRHNMMGRLDKESGLCVEWTSLGNSFTRKIDALTLSF